jgi:hypothetical protein
MVIGTIDTKNVNVSIQSSAQKYIKTPKNILKIKNEKIIKDSSLSNKIKKRKTGRLLFPTSRRPKQIPKDRKISQIPQRIHAPMAREKVIHRQGIVSISIPCYF